jgi:hypothetical protein
MLENPHPEKRASGNEDNLLLKNWMGWAFVA